MTLHVCNAHYKHITIQTLSTHMVDDHMITCLRMQFVLAFGQTTIPPLIKNQLNAQRSLASMI